jgi:hypothetical protein
VFRAETTAGRVSLSEHYVTKPRLSVWFDIMQDVTHGRKCGKSSSDSLRHNESNGDLAAMINSSVLISLAWCSLGYLFLDGGEGGLAIIASMASLTTLELAQRRGVN